MFEIPARASKLHSYSKEQRWALLLEHDKCLDRGAKAAFYRAVGIHSSTIRTWMMARESGRLLPPGALDRVSPEDRSRWMNNRERAELNHLRKENENLRAKLEKSEAAVDILGKASALLEAMAKSAAATDPHLLDPEPTRPQWLKGQGDETSSSK